MPWLPHVTLLLCRVNTVGGDAYMLEDGGHCKDLKLGLKKPTPPGELGDPSTFIAASHLVAEVDTRYGARTAQT